MGTRFEGMARLRMWGNGGGALLLGSSGTGAPRDGRDPSEPPR